MTPQQQAQQCLNRNCLVLDTETTGLDDKAEIIEIAVIDATGKVLLNTLVKPSKPIPAEATSIHGITDEMVKDAPTWPEVNPQLCSLISGKTIAIYNAEYDLRLLEQTDRIWKVTPKISVMPQIVCAMHEYAEFYGQKSDRGGYKWQRLTAAAEQQGVIIEGTPHRALSDCLTTLGVIKAMAAGGYHRASHGITAQKAVDILNGLLQVDHAAITALVNNRVFCSEKLAKETSVDFYDGHYLIRMTLTTEQLKARIAHYRELAYRYGKLGNPKHEAQYRDDAAFLEELLANREAQPVGYIDPDSLKEYRGQRAGGTWSAVQRTTSGLNMTTPIYTAPQAPAVPDGFKLVPTVPTPEMIAAAMNCDDVTFINLEDFCVNFGNIYAAMLAATPGQRE